jgi:hypothetical protein
MGAVVLVPDGHVSAPPSAPAHHQATPDALDLAFWDAIKDIAEWIGETLAAVGKTVFDFIKDTINRDVWRAIGSINGGEVVSADQY